MKLGTKEPYRDNPRNSRWKCHMKLLLAPLAYIGQASTAAGMLRDLYKEPNTAVGDIPVVLRNGKISSRWKMTKSGKNRHQIPMPYLLPLFYNNPGVIRSAAHMFPGPILARLYICTILFVVSMLYIIVLISNWWWPKCNCSLFWLDYSSFLVRDCYAKWHNGPKWQ